MMEISSCVFVSLDILFHTHLKITENIMDCASNTYLIWSTLKIVQNIFLIHIRVVCSRRFFAEAFLRAMII